MRMVPSTWHSRVWKELNDPDAVAIFEGDDGGQIYAVVPVSQIACPETSLERLLADFDKFCWNDPDGRRIYYERWPAGS